MTKRAKSTIRHLSVQPPPSSEETERVSAEVLRKETLELVRAWIVHRQGSPADLIRHLEEEAGWPARHLVLSVLSELRACKELPAIDRKYLTYTLNDGAVAEALAHGADPSKEHQSSLDDLFRSTRNFRRSAKFAEAVDFVSRFRDYSPFNNNLVFAQNPLATYFATASHWHKAFRRTIKEEARGIVLLAPKGPVLIVYDIADTEGPPLPAKLQLFSKTSGRFDPMIFQRALKNCERDRIRVERKPMGQLRAGFATSRVHDSRWKLRIGIRAELNDADAYSVLCHELAHIYLGHMGTDTDSWWPHRLNLPYAVTEIEAEATAYIVCRRAGLRTHSAAYLSSYVDEESNLQSVSLDLVSRVAGRIEEMGRRLLPPRMEESGVGI